MSPWRPRSPAVQGWFFHLPAARCTPPPGGRWSRRRRPEPTRWLNSKFNSVYECGSESVRILKMGCGPRPAATPHIIRAGRLAISPSYLLQYLHMPGFNRLASWLRCPASMLCGR